MDFREIILVPEEESEEVDTHGSQIINCDNLLFEKEIRFNKSQFIGGTDFRNCKFQETIDFYKSEFFGDVRFNESVFFKKTFFSDVVFHAKTRFNDAKFCHYVSFTTAEFKDSANFSNVNFGGQSDVSFQIAVFHEVSYFVRVHFDKIVLFNGVEFRTGINFFESSFLKNVDFRLRDGKHVVFNGNANFEKCSFVSSLNFEKSEFKGPANFEGVALGNDTNFSDVDFLELKLNQIEVPSGGLFTIESKSKPNPKSFNAPVQFKIDPDKIKGDVLLKNVNLYFIQASHFKELEKHDNVTFDEDCAWELNSIIYLYPVNPFGYRSVKLILKGLSDWIESLAKNIRVLVKSAEPEPDLNNSFDWDRKFEISIEVRWKREGEFELFHVLYDRYMEQIDAEGKGFKDPIMNRRTSSEKGLISPIFLEEDFFLACHEVKLEERMNGIIHRVLEQLGYESDRIKGVITKYPFLGQGNAPVNQLLAEGAKLEVTREGMGKKIISVISSGQFKNGIELALEYSQWNGIKELENEIAGILKNVKEAEYRYRDNAMDFQLYTKQMADYQRVVLEIVKKYF